MFLRVSHSNMYYIYVRTLVKEVWPNPTLTFPLSNKNKEKFAGQVFCLQANYIHIILLFF